MFRPKPNADQSTDTEEFLSALLRGLVGAGYRVSKTLAEKKAWELSKEPLPYFSLSAREVQVDPCLGLRLGVELAVLNPGFVIGWVLSSLQASGLLHCVLGDSPPS